MTTNSSSRVRNKHRDVYIWDILMTMKRTAYYEIKRVREALRG